MYRKNITRLAFAIVILSFVLSTFVSLWSLRIMAQRNMQEVSKALASRIYDTISGELMEPITVSRAMANDSLLAAALKNEAAAGNEQTERVLSEYLSRQKQTFGYEAAFVVSDASMCYYSYGGIGKQMDLSSGERDRWYAEFIESGKAYDLDVDRDELSQDQITVFVDARIEDEAGALLGVCGVGARMTGNQDLFVSLEREYGVKINLVAPDGLILIDTDESRIDREYMTDLRLSAGSDYVYQKRGSDRFVVTKYIDKLGWYLVVNSDGSAERGQIVSMLLVNAVLCVIVLVIMLLAVRIIVERTRALASASFVDQSTQLLNRRAFEEKKAELSMGPLKDDFVYVTADLNGLKGVNDTLGHAAGDELIRGAAQCLKACLGKYGDVYRIGGDEFAAMLNLPEDQLNATMKQLELAAKEWRGEQVMGVSISCGHATKREFPSENLAELIRISDERMYDAKEAYYRKSGIERRR